MIDSKGSVVVCGERSEVGLLGVVVVRHCCGEREYALQDTRDHSTGGSCAVLFQAELPFQRVEY